MNKHRRKILKGVVEGLRELLSPQIWDLVPESLRKYADDVESVCDEEEMALDAIPENMQMSQRYDDMLDNVSDLSDANADLLMIADELEENPDYDKDVEYGKDMNGAIGHIEKVMYR